ncbi:MAG TPA: NAD(P)H-binding protein [Ferruginibacter sp.]|nr:NAD(P)H-binding protein [Ferruginibacter sp.]
MNLIVFGATGLVGKQLTEQALYTGHQVRAFGRNVFTTDYLQTDNLHRVQGALFDAHEVYDATTNRCYLYESVSLLCKYAGI